LSQVWETQNGWKNHSVGVKQVKKSMEKKEKRKKSSVWTRDRMKPLGGRRPGRIQNSDSGEKRHLGPRSTTKEREDNR